MDFPTLPQDVININKRLVDHFGVDTVTGSAMWRISWSNDQYEKRLTDCTDEGLTLLYPEVRELPKYQWVKDRWILERLCLVPEINLSELPTQKQSYECMYPFENAYTGEALPPNFEAAKFVVDTVYAAMGKSNLSKYVDEEAKNPIEAQRQRVDKLQEELFGDESAILGRTITGESVAYTGEPKISSQDSNKGD